MTSKPRRLQSRRERNRELGRQDAAHRCGVCKVALPRGSKVFLNWADPKIYCSEDCRTHAAGGGR